MSLFCLYHIFIGGAAFPLLREHLIVVPPDAVIKKFRFGCGLGIEKIFVQETTILSKIMHENIVSLIVVPD